LQSLKIYAKDKIMKVDGQKIKEFREGLGLTTKDLAHKITPKVTRQAVESWESYGVKTFRTLAKVAKALNVPPGLLIDNNGD
jgi:DNA-binding transcriptional regulator YiaG